MITFDDIVNELVKKTFDEHRVDGKIIESVRYNEKNNNKRRLYYLHYSEEEKRNHIPHWCSDVITKEQAEGIISEEIPGKLTSELIRQREEDEKMLEDFFAEQLDNK